MWCNTEKGKSKHSNLDAGREDLMDVVFGQKNHERLIDQTLEKVTKLRAKHVTSHNWRKKVYFTVKKV